MKILVLIPARSGSKGIPHKNIKLLNNLPLLVYSIKQAQQSKYFPQMKVVVSTDDEKYQKIAEEYGAEVPILRPKEISQDNSTDFEFINHMVNFLKDNQDYYPEVILHLRPTQPLRRVIDIDKALDLFIEHYQEYDSLRSVIETEKTPYKMYQIENNHLKPLIKLNHFTESFNVGRQYLPKTYLHNGYLDILKPELLKNNKISGERIYPYLMNQDDIYDIDTIEDWIKVENYLENNI